MRRSRTSSRSCAGEQRPRGWGLFLIRNMVDAMDVTTEATRHTVWLDHARPRRTASEGASNKDR